RLNEQARSEGILRGLKLGVVEPIPSGMLLHVEATALYWLFGPSRLIALLPNFAYFALFQCALAGTLRWLSGRWSVALLGIGVLLTAHAPYTAYGGLMDFRIDFIALSLFGIFICIVVRSEFFSSLPLALLAGAVAALLSLFRYIAIVYVAGI